MFTLAAEVIANTFDILDLGLIMEHFNPFVHARKLLGAIPNKASSLWRPREPEADATQEQAANVRSKRFSWPWRRQKVVAAVKKHLLKEAIRLAMRAEFREAIGFFEKAEEEDAKEFALYYNWGLALSHMGDHDPACEKYRAALECDPTFVDALVNWGFSLAALEMHEEAIERFVKATEINPDFAPAYFNWGCSLGELGRWEEACEKFEKAGELDPKDAQVHYNWAIALAHLDKSEAVEEHLKTFLHLARGRYPEQAARARQVLDECNRPY